MHEGADGLLCLAIGYGQEYALARSAEPAPNLESGHPLELGDVSQDGQDEISGTDTANVSRGFVTDNTTLVQ